MAARDVTVDVLKVERDGGMIPGLNGRSPELLPRRKFSKDVEVLEEKTSPRTLIKDKLPWWLSLESLDPVRPGLTGSQG